jgi:hypothetical protein
MIMKIFSVRDTQVEAFLQPFFSPTMGAAIRSLTEAVNDPQHTFAKHAADYSLYTLAEFDDSSGVITPNDPHRICGLMDLIKS